MARQEGWLLALGSVLLSASFSLGLFVVTALFFRTAALDRALDQSKISLFTQAKKFLSYAQSTDALLAYAPFYQHKPLQYDAYSNLLSFGEGLIRRDSNLLSKSLSEITPESRLSPLSQDLELLLKLNDAATIARKVKSIPADAQAGLTEKYRKLQGDLGLLLSLPVLPNVSELKFYEDGIFIDLPVLDQIRRSPKDLQALRNVLAAVGGEVKIPLRTEDPKKFFLDKIEHLRIESRSIQDNLETLGVTKSDLSKSSNSQSIEEQLLEKEHQITAKLQRILENISSSN